ncbi:MAG TPA: sigma-70 family RNA polymerase sigma factor [Ignavibacteriaceae bacterium]|nr:sigma-70 family RNA polymerase sigma factor [Ignavibacteriaceae bacterium]
MIPNDIANFELTILPHLDAAYNFARWLTRNNEDAADIVQEACLRAMKYYNSYRGGDGRAWLFTIIRNIFYTRNDSESKSQSVIDRNFNPVDLISYESNPELIYQQNENKEMLHKALELLPVEFREIIILRELEGLDYKEIANIAEIPIGTVMSRLSRGRKILSNYLVKYYKKEGLNGMQ